MRILLDENLPESLIIKLIELGHHVDSINRLKLKGLDNGTLWDQVAVNYDLLFTRDTGFANNVRQSKKPQGVKLVRVALQQSPATEFVAGFLSNFGSTDWNSFESGDDWP